MLSQHGRSSDLSHRLVAFPWHWATVASILTNRPFAVGGLTAAGSVQESHLVPFSAARYGCPSRPPHYVFIILAAPQHSMSELSSAFGLHKIYIILAAPQQSMSEFSSAFGLHKILDRKDTTLFPIDKHPPSFFSKWRNGDGSFSATFNTFFNICPISRSYSPIIRVDCEAIAKSCANERSHACMDCRVQPRLSKSDNSSRFSIHNNA